MGCGRTCSSCLAYTITPACGVCGTRVNPVTGLTEPNPGVCGPGEGSVPITSAEYQSSLGVCLQDTVDQARRLEHSMGLRPYRVVLMWVKRSRKQRLVEVVRELELMPVLVSALTGVRWESTMAGMTDQGDIILSEISPAQVDYSTLQGKLDGEIPPPDVEFFYELRQLKRCEGDPEPSYGRYTPATIPSYSGTDFAWTIILTAQQQARAGEPTRLAPDQDQTFVPTTVRRRGGLLR